MLRQVLRVADIGEPEALRVAPEERCDVLPLRRKARIARGRLERFERKHFRIEPVRIGRRMYVADIVHAGTPSNVLGKHATRDRRVQERTVRGDPHNRLGARLTGRKAKPVEHILLAAADASETGSPRENLHLVIRRAHRGCQHDLRDARDRRCALGHMSQHGAPREVGKRLAGQARRAEPRLDDRDRTEGHQRLTQRRSAAARFAASTMRRDRSASQPSVRSSSRPSRQAMKCRSSLTYMSSFGASFAPVAAST